jgi:hypothetical protein
MVVDTEKAVSRRRFFIMSLAGVAGASIALVSTTARVEARPKWGNPPGWSRGRKRGWSKRGGPKWR